MALPSSSNDDSSGIDPAATLLVDDGGTDPTAMEIITVADEDTLDESLSDVAELFSPPRLCARAARFGLVPGFSHDLRTQMDLSTFEGRAQSWSELCSTKPKVLVASPPCTWFSTLQHLNKGRYSVDVWARKEQLAMSLLSFAALCCKLQYTDGRGFIFEHPWTATSWHRAPLVELAALDGVASIDFDQCSTGLVGPNGQSIKKRTKLLTNVPGVIVRFSAHQCSCTTDHLHIEGSCLGIQLSRYCQVYTPRLCEELLWSISDYVHGHPSAPINVD